MRSVDNFTWKILSRIGENRIASLIFGLAMLFAIVAGCLIVVFLTIGSGSDSKDKITVSIIVGLGTIAGVIIGLIKARSR